MNLHLAVFTLKLYLADIRAIKVVYDLAGNTEVANNATNANTTVKFGMLDEPVFTEMLEFTHAYAEFRCIGENYDKVFPGKVPQGVICLFTVKMKGENTGKIKVIKLDESGNKIFGGQLVVESTLNQFAYKELSNLVAEKHLEAKKIAKDFISNDLFKDITVRSPLNSCYKSVGYFEFPFLGVGKDGIHIGEYMFFAVLYSKVEGIL